MLTDAAVLPGDTPPVDARDPQRAFAKYKRLVPWAVGLSLATLVVLSVYYQTRRGADVLAELQGVSAWTVPAAVGLHLVMQACWGLRIKLLGEGLGAPVPYRRALGLVTSGLFAAAVTPGRVGGEPWRIAMLVRGGASGAAASRTILADRATDMVFFLVLGGLAALALPLIFGDADRIQALGFLSFAGLAVLMAILILALVRPRPLSLMLAALARVVDRLARRAHTDHAPAIETFLREVTSGLRHLVREKPMTLAGAALLSVALWSCELSILWVVLQGFGFDAPYLAVYMAAVLVVMIASVPALPGGTGLAELAALTLLTPLAPGLTPAFLVVWRGLTYYVDLSLGAVVASLVVKRRPSARSAPTA